MNTEFINKVKRKYKENKKLFFIECYIQLKRRIKYLNISNENMRELVSREDTYKFAKRKFKKYLVKRADYLERKNNYQFSNKLWICWLQGIEGAPELVKTCINSVKKAYPEKEIIIITEDNLKDYIELPDYILEKRKKGVISNAHFSDIIRLALLVKHGGLWCDASVLITGDITYFNEKTPLFAFKDIMLMRNQNKAISCSSWFIYSCKNNNILTLALELILEYWKKYNYTRHYFLMHILFTLATEVYADEWKEVPTVSNVPPHILQYEFDYKYSSERIEEIKKCLLFIN